MKKSIIIVLVIGIIIVGGLLYFLWRDPNDNTAQTAQDLPVSSKNKPARANQSKDSYLTVKEWNVRMKLPEEIKHAKYTYGEYNGPTYSLETVALKDDATERIKGCKDQPVLTINRAKSNEPILPSGYTVDQVIKDGNEQILVKIGDHYYHAYTGGGPCYQATDSKGQKAYRQLEHYFGEAYKTLESAD